MDSIEIPVSGGFILRIIYEMTVGDLLVTAAIAALVMFLILDAIRRTLWRR